MNAFRPSPVRWLMSLALAFLFSLPVAANELGPLVDLLVRKGIITLQEAETVRAELALEFADTSAGKMEIAEDVRHFELTADARIRHQYEDVTKAGASEGQHRSRLRYRLKLGAFYQFSGGWNSGLQLETAESSDSTNANFGGYFDKHGDDLYIGQVYLDYANPHDWADLVNLTFGKKKHPFLLDSAFWDSDTNPEGFTQQLGWRHSGDSWFVLRAGEYLIDEAKESSGANARDDWLFVAQAEYNRYLGRKTNLRIAPFLLAESGGSTSAGESETGDTPNNENAINSFNDLFIVGLPVRYTFLANEIPQTLFGTVGYNLDANDAVNRTDSSYRPSFATAGEKLGDEGLFFNLGYRFGSARHFKDWQFSVEYRYLEAAALTPNLSDSDFAKNSLNQHGWVAGGAYMLSESVRLQATYMSSRAIIQDWASAAAANDQVKLFQFDLSAKF